MDPVPNSSFARNSAVMAVGTTLSRVTGLARLLALVYAVHFGSLADAYNLANTLPNIIHDIVLGGIVAATFLPVFVARLATVEREDDQTAWDAISAVVSMSAIVIVGATVLFFIVAPWIIDATTALDHGSQVGLERSLATTLLRLFVPQLTCYGLISVATALLNARNRFAAPMFAPVANNVVLVAALIAFGLVDRHPQLSWVYSHRGELYLLGLGTTAGVVVQLLCMIPSLRSSGLHLRWYPRPRHEAVRTVVGLSGYTVGLVLANQVALVVVLALSVRIGTGAVSAYTYAWQFFQLPYGVVGVSLMSAAAPELAKYWAQADIARFTRRMDTGMRAMLGVIIPAAVGMALLARPTLALLGHMIGRPSSTGATAQSLAMLAVGLPGFCVFIYVIRTLQSMQRLRPAFWLYLAENGLNIVGAVAMAGALGVRGIALSISIAYTLGALVGVGYLRRTVGGLDRIRLGRPVLRVAMASVGLLIGAALGVSLTGGSTAIGALVQVFFGVLFGLAGFVLVAAVMAALQSSLSARRRPSRQGGSSGQNAATAHLAPGPRHGRGRLARDR
ncbi:MAG: murein biosynthesis integral membrane protein MurJ [Acidimicrobiales bacterium]